MGENRGPRAGRRVFRNAPEKGKGAKRRQEDTRASWTRPRRAVSPAEASGQRGGRGTPSPAKSPCPLGARLLKPQRKKTKNPVRNRETPERTLRRGKGRETFRSSHGDTAGAATHLHCPPATTAGTGARLSAAAQVLISASGVRGPHQGHDGCGTSSN